MTGGTINDITNLKFFIDKGYEIPMLKLYVLTWEIIPSEDNSLYVKQNPSGYFIGDVDLSDPTNVKIKNGSFQCIVLEYGKVFARFSDAGGYDENGKQIFLYSSLPSKLELYSYMHDFLFDQYNQVKLSININNTTYSSTNDISLLFDIAGVTSGFEDYIYEEKIYTGSNTNGNNEYYEYLGVKKIDLVEEDSIPAVQTAFETLVTNIGLYFPFIRYSGSFIQDTISSGFIASNTIIIVEENDNNGTTTYERPYIASSNNYSLVFLPANDSEIKIISSDSLYELQYDDEKSFYLADQDTTSSGVTPLSFAVGFQADIEGAYLNFLGIYMRSSDNPNIPFFMGCIVVKTLVEGEDERFRTLLGNFGVVDPILYPNLFAEQEYQEQGKDFTLINRKSKELMLTYDLIFSYVGTYKALFNAIKFLGYNDIVFKEWYTLKDANDIETDIAVLVFDTSTGEFLKLKLADFGVSIEDFKAYNKINRLTMVYHLNEVDDNNYEYINLQLVRYLKATVDASGAIVDPSTFVKLGNYTKLSEVPLTRPIYEYRNEEILAKLLGVKRWLEINVIGVNAYIADITGEGVYFGWEKSQAYATLHYLKDYSQEQYYTADVKSIKQFKNSSSAIRCTLTELNDGVKFCEYEYTPFEVFDKFDTSIHMESASGVELDISTMITSNSIEAPVVGDEYSFEVSVRPEYGTLCEWTSDGSSLILYNTGELNLLFEQYSEAVIDSSCLPIITLENANIHKCYEKWRQNIEWSVKEVIDLSTGNTNYRLKNFGTYRSDSYAAYDNNYFVLIPVYSGASIKYSENNKYHLPMLIIKGYEFDRTMNEIDSSHFYQYELGENNEYILEILKGDINFKQVGNVGALLSFSNDKNYINYPNQLKAVNTYELEIAVQYTYESDKKAFVLIDTNNILNTIDSCIFDYSLDVSALDSSIIDQYYNSILSDRSTFIQDPNLNIDNVALADASAFLSSSSYISELEEFKAKKKELLEKELLYRDFIKIYNDNYKFNQYIDTSITRLGSYDVVAKAYDKYNNIFTSKYDKTAEVKAGPIYIDTYVAQSNSSNNNILYKYDVSGVLCSSTDILTLMDNSDTLPVFPKNYHIYDFDYNSNNNTIEFDNLSYAIDTPKNNDYVVFDNFSELCSSIELSGNYTKLNMLDENPDRVYLYNPSILVKVIVYDKTLLDIYVNLGPYSVLDSSKQDTLTDISYQDDSYLIIDGSSDSSILSCINNNLKYVTYVLNTTEYDISIYDIDYDNKSTSLILTNSLDIDGNSCQAYNKEDVIKIRYYLDTSVGSILDSIINESSYRITNIEKIDGTFIYTINGLINEYLIDEANYRVVLTIAAHDGVHYIARVTENGIEYNYPVGNGNYVIRDIFKYNTSQMLLDDYIDDTFSGIVYDYDAEDLKKTWFDINSLFDPENMDLYYYHNFPITILKGKKVVFNHHDKDNVLMSGYHVQWKDSAYLFDDFSNWDSHKNEMNLLLLYRSVNDILSIEPEYLGPHNIELECIDKYGNRVVNSGSGILYVK